MEGVVGVGRWANQKAMRLNISRSSYQLLIRSQGYIQFWMRRADRMCQLVDKPCLQCSVRRRTAT